MSDYHYFSFFDALMYRDSDRPLVSIGQFIGFFNLIIRLNHLIQSDAFIDNVLLNPCRQCPVCGDAPCPCGLVNAQQHMIIFLFHNLGDVKCKMKAVLSGVRLYSAH